jgi:hypothetical protein
MKQTVIMNLSTILFQTPIVKDSSRQLKSGHLSLHPLIAYTAPVSASYIPPSSNRVGLGEKLNTGRCYFHDGPYISLLTLASDEAEPLSLCVDV